MSAASSTYSSSRTSFSSLSEKPRMRSSLASGSISTNVSAACSFGSRRNMRGICFSSSPSKSPATSIGFMVARISRRVAYFFSSSSFRRAFSTISKRSAIRNSSYSFLFVMMNRQFTQTRDYRLTRTASRTLLRPGILPLPPASKRIPPLKSQFLLFYPSLTEMSTLTERSWDSKMKIYRFYYPPTAPAEKRRNFHAPDCR